MKRLHLPRRTHMMLYATILGIVVIIMLMLKMCSESTFHTPHKHCGGDTVIVAIEISPVGISLSGDSLSGYYYDMIKEIMHDHGVPIAVTPFNHVEDALRGIDKGYYDIVVADIPITTDIKERYLSTTTVNIDKQVLVQLRDSVTDSIPVTSQLQLAGKQVYLPANSPLRGRLEHLSSELGDTIHIMEDPLYGSEQLVIMTALGQIPNVVVNRRTADILSRDYPMLDTSVEISFNQFQGWIVSPVDSVLCDSLNLWIELYRNSPAMQRLNTRYNQR